MTGRPPAVSGPPRWKRDFPILWEDDQFVTRREFSRFLGVTSFGLLLGTLWTGLRPWVRRAPAPPPGAAAALVSEIPVGGYKLLRHPGGGDRAILIRLAESRFVAYSQICTHLNCPVHLEAEKGRLRCPCHEGFFSVKDGRVLGGPPPRPLPRYEVAVRDGKVWVGPALET